MKRQWRKWIKKISPFALSKNHYYDIITKKVIEKYCSSKSNCIDVGSHEGEILDMFLKIAPLGAHFAFEPIPYLFEKLLKKYLHLKNCHIYNNAISNSDGETTFNHVISNPAYSGIKKRNYDKKDEKDETITVTKKRLDDVIPHTLKIDFIKIDVEGGDFDVMLGAKKIITDSRPLIVFEFGIGGSDIYGATPDLLYRFMNEVGYKVSLLGQFLKKKPSLTLDEFNKEFINKMNYYFIAHPLSLG
jgi:FkbM family methyltransferase